MHRQASSPYTGLERPIVNQHVPVQYEDSAPDTVASWEGEAIRIVISKDRNTEVGNIFGKTLASSRLEALILQGMQGIEVENVRNAFLRLTMTPYSKVVFYRYKGSPFSDKVDSILLLKNIPFAKVEVSSILPRPELSEYLGVTYRRIPILAIGNDVYCDTSLIALALERQFQSSDGYGTIFPAVKDGQGAVDAGIQKAFSTFYCDRALFSLATGALPWGKLSSDFLKDRSALRGTKLNPEALVAAQPIVHSKLSSHLDLAEDQLSDGREWLFNTVTPALSDISLHFVLSWIRPFHGMETVLNKQNFPNTLAWLDRFNEFSSQRAQAGSAPSHSLNGRNAAELIASANNESSRGGFDEVEASYLELKAGARVRVAPDDYGQSHPTQGKLVGLNREEIVIETKGSMAVVVRVHFPRLGFVVTAVPAKL